MSASRIESLFELLKETPDDPFLFYCLALEYQKTDNAQALGYFEKLLNEYPSYVPTYYHAAALYAQLGKRAEAEKTYLAGLAESSQQANHHAYKELRSAYTNFQFEEDEEA